MLTSRRFSIDLSLIPAPQGVESLSYETIFASLRSDFEARWAALRATNPTLPAYDVSMLETDPAMIILQSYAYREMVLRARVNDALRATMLATATGTDLDAIAARYAAVRLVGEQDGPFRERVLLAYEALSTAGTYGGYEYHARSAHPLISDVAVFGPESGYVDPGQSLVVVASSEGLGVPSAGVITAVEAKLNDRNVRALTDEVIVNAVEVLSYTVEAKLRVPRAPGTDAVRALALQRVTALTARRKIGGKVQRSAIAGALHLIDADGAALVQDIEIISPAADVLPTPLQMATCTTIAIEIIQA